MRVMFGPWLPDQPVLDLAGVLVAQNVTPQLEGYGPWPGAAVVSDALTSRCQGAFACKGSDGTVYNFAGDVAKLYKASATAGLVTWGDVTRAAGGAYAVAANAFWEFTQFGDYVIACNGTDNPQKFILGTSSQFASLSGSAPVASHVATIRDFVVFGNLTGAPARVKWSAFNNAEDYNAAPATTQSDYQDLIAEGQTIQRIIGGEYGVILTDRSLWTMRYVGSDVIWQFDEVEKDTGCHAPGSVAKSGENIFYLSPRGFMMWNGQQSIPIGAEKVDRYFLDDLDPAYRLRISAAIDPINKLYVVSYAGPSNGGVNTKLMIYSWVADKWATAVYSHEYIWVSAGLGFTLDQITSSLDALPYSLDDPYWQGGARTLSGFTTTIPGVVAAHKMFTWNGAAMTATITTGDGQLNPDGRAFINTVAPVVTGYSGSVGVTLSYRDNLSNKATALAAQNIDAFQRTRWRNQARYHRLTVTAAGGFDHMRGADVAFKAAGVR